MINIKPINNFSINKYNALNTKSNLQYKRKQNINFGDKFERLELAAYSIGEGQYPLSGVATFQDKYSDAQVALFNKTHKLPEGYYLVYQKPSGRIAKKTGDMVTIPAHYSLEKLSKDRVKELRKLNVVIYEKFDTRKLKLENNDDKTYIKDVRINDINEAKERVKKDRNKKLWAAAIGIAAMVGLALFSGIWFIGDAGFGALDEPLDM